MLQDLLVAKGPGTDFGNLCEACLPVMAVQEQLEADLDARFEALDAIPHRFQQFKLNFQAKAGSVRVLRRTSFSIGVRSPKFIWAPCAQLYPFSETLQTSPPPAPPHEFWARIRGRYWTAKIDDIS